MPLENISQPDLMLLSPTLRLRKYDGNYESFLAGYQDPYVYQNSEGIFDDAKKPDLSYVKGMCDYLSRVGELYYIEVKQDDAFLPVGDVTIKTENPPIAIWVEKYRGVGIGSAVMRAVIERLRTLGFTRITGSTVYKWNIPSQRMHERLGFCRTGEDGDEIYYALEL
ncbi:MAG: GNAT family N-acetyltransferase [Clostridia bacterium]|nr:GNAT family N-acetyltransferase [Clostridia bacterium]